MKKGKNTKEKVMRRKKLKAFRASNKGNLPKNIKDILK